MPYTPGQPFLVAAVQISPVFLDRDATIERACDAIADAASRGARLVAFPEAFVPGYPMWIWSIAAGKTQELRALYAELLDQAITIPSAAVERLCDAARCRARLRRDRRQRAQRGSERHVALQFPALHRR